MNHPHSTHHDLDEISRLNEIIKALLFKQKAMEDEIQNLRDLITNQDLPASKRMSAQGRTDSDSSNAIMPDGRKEISSSMVANVMGRSEDHFSNRINHDGSFKMISSNRQAAEGRIEAIPPDDRTDEGILKLMRPLPHPLRPLDFPFLYPLNNALARFKELSQSGPAAGQNTAKIMIFLHNNRSGNQRELRAETNMSEGGMAKRIMALKRYGWIKKEKYARFVLTEKGTLVMLAALNKGAPWHLVEYFYKMQLKKAA